MKFVRSAPAACLMAIAIPAAHAQQQEKPPAVAASLHESNASGKTAPAAAPAPPASTGAGRWIQFHTLDASTRFRYVDQRLGRVTDRDQQYKFSGKIQCNLVPEGRAYFQARVETGSSFASSWTNMGPGLNEGQWVLNVKSLFFGQKLGKHFEAQIGGIEYDHGAGSEVTYTDNDAWLVGYRGRVITSGKGWLANKLSITFGHLGDFRAPNVFSRMHRLDDVNYVQALAQKAFSKKHEASIAYDAIQNIHFLRAAYRWKKIPARVFDELSLEPVVRMTDDPSFGWSARLAKTFDKTAQWKAAITYSDIPRALFDKNGQQILLNGDLYSLAKRMSGTLHWQPAADWQVQWHAGRRLDATANAMRWRAQMVLRYNFANLANRALR